MKRSSVALLAMLTLGTACPGYWHDIVVPSAASTGADEDAARARVIGVVERVSLAHGLQSKPVPSPRCTPHWEMAASDSTAWSRTRAWPHVCVDLTRPGGLVVSVDGGERELPAGSRAQRLWLSLRDSLAPFGATWTSAKRSSP